MNVRIDCVCVEARAISQLRAETELEATLRQLRRVICGYEAVINDLCNQMEMLRAENKTAKASFEKKVADLEHNLELQSGKSQSELEEIRRLLESKDSVADHSGKLFYVWKCVNVDAGWLIEQGFNVPLDTA